MVITMFNFFKKTRNQDDIFEQDEIKNSTKRGNQRTFNTRTYLMINFMSFIGIFMVMYVISA